MLGPIKKKQNFRNILTNCENKNNHSFSDNAFRVYIFTTQKNKSQIWNLRKENERNGKQMK